MDRGTCFVKESAYPLFPLASIACLLVLAISIPLRATAANDCSSKVLANELQAIFSAPDIGEIYTRDGAADLTIAYPRKMNLLATHVNHVLECAAKSVPLLVAHLDDQTLTSATINGERVPIGFICLDLLNVLTDRPSPAMVTDCMTDGLCACYNYGFCFDPVGQKIRVQIGDTELNHDVVEKESPSPSVVKRNWEKILKKNGGRSSWSRYTAASYLLIQEKEKYKSYGFDRLSALSTDVMKYEVRTPVSGQVYIFHVKVNQIFSGSGGSVEVLFWVLTKSDEVLWTSQFKMDRNGQVLDNNPF